MLERHIINCSLHLRLIVIRLVVVSLGAGDRYSHLRQPSVSRPAPLSYTSFIPCLYIFIPCLYIFIPCPTFLPCLYILYLPLYHVFISFTYLYTMHLTLNIIYLPFYTTPLYIIPTFLPRLPLYMYYTYLTTTLYSRTKYKGHWSQNLFHSLLLSLHSKIQETLLTKFGLFNWKLYFVISPFMILFKESIGDILYTCTQVALK